MTNSSRPNFNRYANVDADPNAPDESPARLRWEYISLQLEASEFRRRAKRASPDGRLSAQDREVMLGMIKAAMVVSVKLRRALEANRRS